MPDVCDMMIIPLQLTAHRQGLLASDDTIRGLSKYYQGHPEYSAGIFHYQEHPKYSAGIFQIMKATVTLSTCATFTYFCINYGDQGFFQFEININIVI